MIPLDKLELNFSSTRFEFNSRDKVKSIRFFDRAVYLHHRLFQFYQSWYIVVIAFPNITIHLYSLLFDIDVSWMYFFFFILIHRRKISFLVFYNSIILTSKYKYIYAYRISHLIFSWRKNRIKREIRSKNCSNVTTLTISLLLESFLLFECF